MPPYEITRTVRRAGFDPLAPPLREGSIYVVRATDFRGILMRVVVDARSGAIRDATRIVAGPGSYGPQLGMVPYEPLPNERPVPYGMPAEFEVPPVLPLEDGEAPSARPLPAHPVTRASVIVLPPLPRPRPPELVARKPVEDAISNTAKPAATSETKPDRPASDGKAPEKPGLKPDVTGSAAVATPQPPAAAPSTPAAPSIPVAPPTTAAAKPAKSLEPPPIND